MKAPVRFGIASVLGLFPLVLLGPAVAAGPPATCRGDVLLTASGPGTSTTAGEVTIMRDVPFTGTAVLTLPGGAKIGGAVHGTHDLIVNSRTMTAEVEGQIVGGIANNTLTTDFVGHIDYATGAVTAHTVTISGTGFFANFHGEGDGTGQFIAPSTVTGSGSGPCQFTP